MTPAGRFARPLALRLAGMRMHVAIYTLPTAHTKQAPVPAKRQLPLLERRVALPTPGRRLCTLFGRQSARAFTRDRSAVSRSLVAPRAIAGAAKLTTVQPRVS